jgi:hypothetical protein
MEAAQARCLANEGDDAPQMHTLRGWSTWYKPPAFAEWGDAPQEYAGSRKPSAVTAVFACMPQEDVPAKLQSHYVDNSEWKSLTLNEVSSALGGRPQHPDGSSGGAKSFMGIPFRTALPPVKFRVMASQDTCSICKRKFASPTMKNQKDPKFELVSCIKACGHHYHPECIDPLFAQVSKQKKVFSAVCPDCPNPTKASKKNQ